MLLPGSENLEQTACFDLMLAGFARAEQSEQPLIECRYRFGQHTVLLRFAGPALFDVLGTALTHLIDTGDSPVDVTIDLWDSESTGEPVSPLIQFMRSRIAYNHYEFLTPRHEITGISNDRVPATLDQWSGAFSLFDRQRRHGVYWVESADNVPYFERAAPLRTMLSWGLADLGLQSVHAAGVGRPEAGVLLAGRGGSGKSSTALRCLESGMGYLADDYCLISDSPPPEAFSMYSVAKLNGVADLQRMPSFLPHIVNPEAAVEEKLMMYLAERFADQLITSFPVRAVLVPRVTDRPDTVLKPITAAAAMRALGPTTLLQRPGAGPEAMRAMSSFVSSLPCFELQLGSRSEEIPRVIEDLLG
jgi:hypothetical protein